MSLNSNKYLKILDSEKRVIARFHSASLQYQIDTMRQGIHVLFDLVEKLTAFCDKEHGLIYDPTTNDTIPVAAATASTNTERDRATTMS